MKASIAITAALLTAACATPQQNAMTAGQPPAYQAAYSAGCNSGYVAAGHPYYRFTKDVAAYGSDAMYKQGWDDGFSVCKGRYDAIGQAMHR